MGGGLGEWMRTAMMLALLGACNAGQERELLDVPVGSVAFTDVLLVDMLTDSAQESMTVVVHDGRVHTVVESGADLPEHVEVLASGVVVMPGLVDMHVHNWYEEEHLLFVAYGVTTGVRWPRG